MKNCPVCGSDHLVEVVRPEKFQYQGHTATIEDYRSFECQNCGEAFPDQESVDRSEPILRDLHRQAERLLTSSEIRAIRMSLAYSQDDFGLLLGGGKKAFARYENGKVIQARSMDNLLRAVKYCPDILSVLEKETCEPPSNICNFEVQTKITINKAAASSPFKLGTPVMNSDEQRSEAA